MNLELRKSNYQNDLMDRVITSQDYQDMKVRVEKGIVLTREKLSELQQQNITFQGVYSERSPNVGEPPGILREIRWGYQEKDSQHNLC